MMIRGRIRDIQPRQARPTLELYFDAKDRSALPQGTRAGITLDLNGKRWHGTINSTGRNAPYLHTNLSQDSGDRSTATQVFLGLGLAEEAVLDLACEPDATLRLVRIADSGRWRAGNEPGRRKAGGQSTSSRRHQAPATRFSPSHPVGDFGIQHGDVERLATALRRGFPFAQPSTDRAWTRAPALRVIDCVLSLNRRYDPFVVPRLDQFERVHPEVTSMRALRALIDRYPSPSDFVRDALNYQHDDRARILSAVVDFGLGVTGDRPAESELSRLAEWAQSARSGDYTRLSIPGFALAGFQYLRMLFGANTTKPDKHIRAYVGEAVGRTVSDLEALNLLEAGAKEAGIVLRDADTNIWEARVRAEPRQ